jgi:glutaredoxin-like protein
MIKKINIVFLIAIISCFFSVTAFSADKLLPKKIQKQLKKEFKELQEDVELLLFTQEFKCSSCEQNDRLIFEVAKLSPKISVKKYDFVADKKIAEKYGIDKIPATIMLVDNKDHGIRFYGIPGGYEFSSFISAIKDFSAKGTSLRADQIKRLKAIKKPVNIQVLVTPTCPYCTKAVRTAHQFAYYNPLIKAAMVELQEFPYIAQKYNVVGVPMIVINEKVHSNLSFNNFLKAVEKAGK